jgi:uncharacterized protein YihD (DUF1040 family)
MRDPKRIPRILKKLLKFWKKNPDLRLAQLVSNLQGAGAHQDIFFMEDDYVEIALDYLNGEDNGREESKDSTR